MFESVAPETFIPRSRKTMYESLPVSIAVHAALTVAIVVAGTWNVGFPTHTPRMLVAYQLDAPISLPPPPPPPPPPAARQIVPQNAPIGRLPDMAPTIIPDFIPEVLPLTAEQQELPIIENVTMVAAPQGVEGGVAGGSMEGVFGGELGGVVGGVVGSVAPPDTVIVKRDMPLPTAPMSMTYPQYPNEARIRGWEDVVVVRYVIGKNGRVREVTVLDHPEREIFEKVAVKAIRNWRFRPHKKDGVEQEVIHELTVYFRLES
jgi:TonB family protein